MRPASLTVVVVSVLVLSGLLTPVTPSAQPGKAPAVQKVRIVVAEAAVHLEQCKGGKYQPVDILVDANPMNNTPSHCDKGAVHSHGNAHKYEATVVKLSFKAQDSVLWYSDVPFQITSIAPHDDKDAATAPKNPFREPLPTAASKAIQSTPIIQTAVTHRYKITLKINGRDIDPDLWCNP